MSQEEVRLQLQSIARQCKACLKTDASGAQVLIRSITASLVEINQKRGKMSPELLSIVVDTLQRLQSSYPEIPTLRPVLEAHIHFLERHIERFHKPSREAVPETKGSWSDGWSNR